MNMVAIIVIVVITIIIIIIVQALCIFHLHGLKLFPSLSEGQPCFSSVM
jgi:hypothetical protein